MLKYKITAAISNFCDSHLTQMRTVFSWLFMFPVSVSENFSGGCFDTQTTEFNFLELQRYRLWFEVDPALITQSSKQTQQS